MLGEGLQTLLAASSRLQALLGTPSTRADKTTGIFPSLAPKQVNLPYIVYTQIIGETTTSLDGANRLQSARYRFKCYGSNYGNAKKVAQQLKMEMLGLATTLNDSDHTIVEGAWLVLESDNVEEIPLGTIDTTVVDFIIHFVDKTS